MVALLCWTADQSQTTPSDLAPRQARRPGQALVKNGLQTASRGFLIGLHSLGDFSIVRALTNTLGGDNQLVFRDLPVVFWAPPVAWNLDDARNLLLAWGLPIRFIEPNFTRQRLALPNDPELSSQWGVRNTGASINVPGVGNVETAAGMDLNLEAAWDLVTDSTEVIVAVIDDSLDAAHPDLKDLIWLNAGELSGNAAPQVSLGGACTTWSGSSPDLNGDGVFNIQDYACDSRVLISAGVAKADAYLDPTDLLGDGDFADGVDDDGNGIDDDLFGVRFVDGEASNDPQALAGTQDGHGTAVAGCIGAMTNNGSGIAGVNWRVRLLPIAFDFALASELAAFQYAIDQGAQIVNASWGGPEESIGELDGVLSLANKNILLVAAAGNEDTNNDRWVFYPSGMTLSNVLAVAALAPTGRQTDWTQYGQTRVDVAAPGEHVMTTMPLNTAAQYSASEDANALYDYISGTSFASPYAAGVAALVKAAHPSASAAEIKARLLKQPTPVSHSVGYTATDGLLNAEAAILATTSPVLLVSAVNFDDGDDNELDAGDSGELRLHLQNLWQAAGLVTAALLAASPSITIVDANAYYGPLAADQVAAPISGFTIEIADALPAYSVAYVTAAVYADHVTYVRQLRLEIAQLVDGVTVLNTISRHPQDDDHVYHINVPAETTRLQVDADSLADIDLIVWHGGDAITSGVSAQYSQGLDGEEQVIVPNPEPGIWYAHVVNYWAIQFGHGVAKNRSYQISAALTLANIDTEPPPPASGSQSDDAPEPSDAEPSPDTTTPTPPRPVITGLVGGGGGCSASGQAGSPLAAAFYCLLMGLARRLHRRAAA